MRTSPETERAICSDYQKPNATAPLVAARHGVHPDTVLNVLHRNGISPRPRGGMVGRRSPGNGGRNRVPIPPEIQAKICDAYRSLDQASERSVARAFGLTREIIQRVLKSNGVRPIRPEDGQGVRPRGGKAAACRSTGILASFRRSIPPHPNLAMLWSIASSWSGYSDGFFCRMKWCITLTGIAETIFRRISSSRSDRPMPRSITLDGHGSH